MEAQDKDASEFLGNTAYTTKPSMMTAIDMTRFFVCVVHNELNQNTNKKQQWKEELNDTIHDVVDQITDVDESLDEQREQMTSLENKMNARMTLGIGATCVSGVTFLYFLMMMIKKLIECAEDTREVGGAVYAMVKLTRKQRRQVLQQTNAEAAENGNINGNGGNDNDDSDGGN